jgi:hypothetical protein
MVMGMTAAEAALVALRRWAATNRADLVAAAWHAGNRNITALADAAGCGRDAIYADLRARNIDPKSDRQEKPPVLTTKTNEIPGMTELPVPGWRHPNLLKVSLKVESPGTTWEQKRYEFITTPFTGTEPEPEIPDQWRGVHPTDSDLPEGDYERWAKNTQRNQEILLVQRVWAQARFDYLIGQLLKSPYRYGHETAADLWAAYAAARDKLTAAYAALDTTPDNRWRTALLAIVDATAPAELAASNWDATAEKFAEQDRWLLRQLGEQDHPVHAVATAAKKHGVNDAGDWLIGSTYDYEHGSWGRSPAIDEVHQIVEKGDKRIKAVESLLRKN